MSALLKSKPKTPFSFLNDDDNSTLKTHMLAIQNGKKCDYYGYYGGETRNKWITSYVCPAHDERLQLATLTQMEFMHPPIDVKTPLVIRVDRESSIRQVKALSLYVPNY